MGFETSLFGHVIDGHCFGDCITKVDRFVDLHNFHHLVIDGELLENSANYKVSWVSTNVANIYFSISSSLRNCFLNECNKGGADMASKENTT